MVGIEKRKVLRTRCMCGNFNSNPICMHAQILIAKICDNQLVFGSVKET